MKQTWGIYAAKHYDANEVERGSQEKTVILWWDNDRALWVAAPLSKAQRFTDRNLALSELYRLRAVHTQEMTPACQLRFPKLKTFTVISNAVAAERAVSKERCEIQNYISTRVNIVLQDQRDALIKLRDWMDAREAGRHA